MKCPRCDVEMKCDCQACTSRPENESKPGMLQVSDRETDAISCGNCGLTAHIDEWEDLAYQLVVEEHGSLTASLS